MKTIKRLLLTILVLLMIVTAGVVTFAVTPLSSCRFSGHVVSNVSSEGVGPDTDATSRLPADHVQYVEATDRLRLAYRSYIPDHPKAMVLFYHGSGANSGAGYEPIGEELLRSCLTSEATACLMDRGEMQRTRERAFFSKCPSLGLQFIGTAGAALFNRFPTVNPSKPGNMISKITTSF
ncbi:hypothetical protein [Paenibacillus cellulositrophicus]|uniref:hypothetical protein n=1 Tax=Paenibacillus cellulositrophicus TaxID=562959 RepID=UPI001AD66260|nr:hypothetical protein [Paenibacillus cellulositrophicus]